MRSDERDVTCRSTSLAEFGAPARVPRRCGFERLATPTRGPRSGRQSRRVERGEDRSQEWHLPSARPPWLPNRAPCHYTRPGRLRRSPDRASRSRTRPPARIRSRNRGLLSSAACPRRAGKRAPRRAPMSSAICSMKFAVSPWPLSRDRTTLAGTSPGFNASRRPPISSSGRRSSTEVIAGQPVQLAEVPQFRGWADVVRDIGSGNRERSHDPVAPLVFNRPTFGMRTSHASSTTARRQS